MNDSTELYKMGPLEGISGSTPWWKFSKKLKFFEDTFSAFLHRSDLLIASEVNQLTVEFIIL